MKAFGVTDYTNLAPQKCCGQTNTRTDRSTDGAGPLLDLLSLKKKTVKKLKCLNNLYPRKYLNGVLLSI